MCDDCLLVPVSLFTWVLMASKHLTAASPLYNLLLTPIYYYLTAVSTPLYPPLGSYLSLCYWYLNILIFYYLS